MSIEVSRESKTNFLLHWTLYHLEKANPCNSKGVQRQAWAYLAKEFNVLSQVSQFKREAQK